MKRFIYLLASLAMICQVAFTSCKGTDPEQPTTSDDPTTVSSDPSTSSDPSGTESVDPADVTVPEAPADDIAYIDKALAEALGRIDPLAFEKLLTLVNEISQVVEEGDVDPSGLMDVPSGIEEGEITTVTISEVKGIFSITPEEIDGATVLKLTFEKADVLEARYLTLSGEKAVLSVNAEGKGSTLRVSIQQGGTDGYIPGSAMQVEEKETVDIVLPEKVSFKLTLEDDVLAAGNINLKIDGGEGDLIDYSDGIEYLSAKVSGNAVICGYTVKAEDLVIDYIAEEEKVSTNGSVSFAKGSQAILSAAWDFVTDEMEGKAEGNADILVSDKLCLSLTSNASTESMDEVFSAIGDEEFSGTRQEVLDFVEPLANSVWIDVYYGSKNYGHEKRNAEILVSAINSKDVIEPDENSMQDLLGKLLVGGIGTKAPAFTKAEDGLWVPGLVYAFASEEFKYQRPLYPGLGNTLELVKKLDKSLKAMALLIAKGSTLPLPSIPLPGMDGETIER